MDNTKKGFTFKRFENFLKSVVEEMKKVSWTPRKQLMQTTYVVIVGTFITAMYLYAADYVFAKCVSWIMS